MSEIIPGLRQWVDAKHREKSEAMVLETVDEPDWWQTGAINSNLVAVSVQVEKHGWISDWRIIVADKIAAKGWMFGFERTKRFVRPIWAASAFR